MQKTFSALLLLLLFLSVVESQEDSSQAKKLAEEISQALSSGNYDKVVDLTYPKVIELMGGREKMVTEIEKGMKEMKTDGIEIMPAAGFTTSSLVKTKAQKFTIISYVLKMKVPGGYLVRDYFLLGVAPINTNDGNLLTG